MADARFITRCLKNMKTLEIQSANYDGDTTLSEARADLQMLNEEWKNFIDFDKSFSEEVLIEEKKNITLIESTFFKTKQTILRAIKGLEEELAKDNEHDSVHQPDIREMSILMREEDVRLPRLGIDPFCGTYSKFPTFRDCFEASVHHNEKYSKVNKFKYLISFLKGDALRLVSNMTISEQNYDEAWDKLNKRYNKPRLITADLLQHFFALPTVNKISSSSLYQMADVTDEVIRGLKRVGANAESRDPWLIRMLLEKLDEPTKNAWAENTMDLDFPTLEQLLEFIIRRASGMEAAEKNKTNQISTSNKAKIRVHHTIASPTVANQTVICIKCSKDHYLNLCPEFLSLDIQQRREFTSKQGLCFNCLAINHRAITCNKKIRCNICNKRHHVTLHESTTKTIEESNSATSEPTTSSDVKILTTTSINYQSILPTAIVLVLDGFGNQQRCRVLLDCGSQASFISERCVQRLQLPRKNANVVISGISAGKLVTKGEVCIQLCSVHNKEDYLNLNALVLPRLPSGIPGKQVNIDLHELARTIELADAEFFQPGSIDILIGADKFFSVLREGNRQFKNNSIVAQNTLFGWVISGNSQLTNYGKEAQVQVNFSVTNLNLDINIDRTLQRFWEIESVSSSSELLNEVNEAERFFISNHRRNTEGRYIVKMPFKERAPVLGDSLFMANKRFLANERRLHDGKHESLRTSYINSIREYCSRGYLRPVEPTEVNLTECDCCYLPHHAVIKESSETTKVRVVFDGSTKTASGYSLNDTLIIGPTIQPTLWNILLKFRYNRIALAADIEKMYNQILVEDEHQRFQRILWREKPTEELKKYQLTTVTFGLASSSFLATRALKQVALDNESTYPDVVPYILNSFYVDDFLSGAETTEEAKQLKTKIEKILASGGFPLRKWRSNSSEVVQDENLSKITFNDTHSESKILGIQWCPINDEFSFKVDLQADIQPTKRSIISEYSRVFDPLGWLSPCIILMKIIFQDLWLQRLDWDDHIPEETAKIYHKIKNEMSLLEKLRVSRYIPQGDNIELHGFCDASEKAYGAVIYVRSTYSTGEIKVSLLTAKTKVAPIKVVSLPRLELCAADLLVKLFETVKPTLKNGMEIFAWTDSTIVLAWLSAHPSKWKTFVANRTAAILQSIPRNHWNHVKTNDNPADCASRGVLPSKMLELQLWWNGPEWLSSDERKWLHDNQSEQNDQQIYEEQRSSVHISITEPAKNGEHILEVLLEKSSSYNKMVRIVAYVLRCVNNLQRGRTKLIDDCLTIPELENARNTIIKHIQQVEFRNEIRNLRSKNTLEKKSDLKSLAPFIDDKGILRVGGRLENADCSPNTKFPIILPKSHKLGNLIIAQIHKANLHPGPSLTFFLSRQEYWIIGGKRAARKLVRECLICFKANAKTSTQMMGNLPSARVIPARPFSRCGVDYAGPILLASKKGRGATLIKGYLAIFICMVTKAIHIEVVSDLTTEAFIAALRRFCGRRGVPAEIYSDNGTNFVGAKRRLNDIFKLVSSRNFNDAVKEHLIQNKIEWHMIPPQAPHFGGLWEAAVKSVKAHITKYTTNCHLTFEEMSTLVCQIESILNSRPLYKTMDEDTMEALTPAHFLIGCASYSIPERETDDKVHEGSLTRWQFIQTRVKSFWKKFHTEYLNNLQQRTKWQNVRPNIQVNDIVLIKDENLPVGQWALGRIVETHPDSSGMVRVVTLRTANHSRIQRPIVKLCKLPNQEVDENQLCVNGGSMSGANTADSK